ncbi:putative Insecticidal toxin complex protein TccB2 [Arthrobotrys musiformis]|uniref:Insecticidal toxin complex protein TccB2 n=1 Tax=Arthrobotrys musiformis TaxID=47236 RepID=A0AAV9WM83_9PEZI
MDGSGFLRRKVELIQSVLQNKDAPAIETFVTHLEASKGNISLALDAVKDDSKVSLTPEKKVELIAELKLTAELADISDNNVGFVEAARSQRVTDLTLRAFATNSNLRDISEMLMPPKPVSNLVKRLSTSGVEEPQSPSAAFKDAAVEVRRKLFLLEPTGVVMRMIKDNEIELESSTSAHVFHLLDEQPEFDLRKTPVTSLIAKSTLFKNLPSESQEAVETNLKTLQRAQSLSPAPETINPLIKNNLTSALHISNMSERAFVRQLKPDIGDKGLSTSIHRHAVESRVRNENFLVSSLQAVRGSGLRVIDGGNSKANFELRKESFNAAADGVKTQVNLEQLFGSLDFCECSDCNSVYSPASYYVELLEFLRHNNLSDKNSNTGSRSIKGTQLEMLLKRRPDLACIELTCENTNTLIPYIDLALEVMESYIVHAPVITAYNVHGETSNELLCSPQHTNLDAYPILRSSVYPLDLPYHLPIDTMRVFLQFLKTSRQELLWVFRPAAANSTSTTPPSPSTIAIARAYDAEFNLITQEEYVILTKEAFLPNIVNGGGCQDPSDYARKIGLRQPWEYFGYSTKADMLNDEPKKTLGLSWVKAQFLKRTGILYSDLVELLKTRYINPNMPTGKALSTMERIKFSYRFLQYLVLNQYPDKRRRFSRLIKFLELADEYLPLPQLIDRQKEVDLCADQNSVGCGCHDQKPQPHHHCCCGNDEWTNWVCKWFERAGKIIVLESGEGPRIPIKGRVWAEYQSQSVALTATTSNVASTAAAALKTNETSVPNSVFLGDLKDDGALVDGNGTAVGFVTWQGKLLNLDGKEIRNAWQNHAITVYADDSDIGTWQKLLGYISNEGGYLYYRYSPRGFRQIEWTSARDTCDITKTRLLHLNGTQLSPEEYEYMARFLRLWKKLGWAMNEVDEAIVGLGKTAKLSLSPNETEADSSDSDDDYTDSAVSKPQFEINATLIHQLVAVKKLLDLTGLSLEVALTFWTDIPTYGDKSLYARTFLTHNIVRMDPVFQPDANGNPLTSQLKITEHLPVLQATLRLKSADISTIRQLRNIPDVLSLSTLSELYRFFALIRYLNIRVELFPDVQAILGDPFKDADTTLAFVQKWQDITNSNFTFQQLNYLIRGVDNISRPVAPTPQKILKLAKTLLDSLEAIGLQNTDVSQEDVDNKVVVLTDLIPAKLALIFDPTLSVNINNLINGLFVFTTNSPSGLDIKVPDALSAKVKYVDQKASKPPTASLVVTGILTEDESNSIKALSSHPLWSPAVDRIKKQGATFYNQYLATIFPTDGATTLLAGDTPDTPTVKGLYFLKYFMPFLRARLATAAVQQAISDVLGTEPVLTSYLLNIVKSSSGDSALSVLLALKDTPPGIPTSWKGYLIPPTTDKYIIVATSDTKPPDFVLNGQPFSFPHQSEDPNNIWSSDEIPFVAGTLYELQLSGTTPDILSWRTATSPPTIIPSSALLPALSSTAVADVLTGLTKISLLIQGFNLSVDELAHLHDNSNDFAALADNSPLNLIKITLGTWKRLFSYTTLRDSLPKQQTRLIDLFAWSKLPTSTASGVVTEISNVTLWDTEQSTAILSSYNALDPKYFGNEIMLLKLREALGVVKKTQISVPLLFEWAKPLSLSEKSYQKLAAQAETLKQTLRGRYNADDWEKAAKPLFDTLRKNQRDALVAYLVVEPSLVETGLVNDADGLFEYFLIDCQMSSCLQTSRIKQATATIQLYVQRCLLGLEAEVGTTDGDLIDRDRWEWMKRYRVWEANRKVYLYPENWIVPSLRDDKTPFFLDLESSLQQKDTNLTGAAESLKGYIYNVASVANMKVYGLFVKQYGTDENKIPILGVHIVSRTMNPPFTWYSRDYAPDGTWSPWVKMPVDIPNYDVDDNNGGSLGSGSYVSPFLWQGNPVIFFMQMVLKQVTVDNPAALSSRWNADGKSQSQNRPYWQINLGVSRFNNGKWTPKELSQTPIGHLAPKYTIKDGPDNHDLDTYPVPNQARYQMVPRGIASNGTSPEHVQIDIIYTSDLPDPANSEQFLHNNTNVGHFLFVDGGISHKVYSGGGPSVDTITNFQYVESSNTIYAYHADDSSQAPPHFNQSPSVTYPTDPKLATKSSIQITSNKQYTFNHTFIDPLLKRINTTNNLAGIYDDFSTLSVAANENIPDDPFGRSKLRDVSNSYNELMSPYGIYNWEFGLHAPMTLIDSLLNAQQFDDALKVCHLVFDPSAVGAASSTDNSQFWKFAPFKALANDDAKESLENMFLKLSESRQSSDPDITAWRDKPFSPHSVARTRPVAYMKWIAMKYIEVLIAYGDYYFRQNSLETIPDAIQCYVLASHVYGPQGQKIPKRGKTKPQTYNSLLNRWDAFGNAIVQLEIEFPFSNQTSQIIGSSNGIIGFANIFGFSSSLYFCIPANPQLTVLRDTIDDRLYKIRNCMDINGVHRQLALFDAPIDPALLVAATAQGLSLDTVLNDLSGPIPNYRFPILLAKAIELCGELKSLGAGLLAAKEKKDNEAISVLRASHETIISGFTLDMKNRALDEAKSALDQLVQSREAPKYRLQYYKFLVGLTDGAPEELESFDPLENPSLTAPVADGQLLLLPEESEEINKSLAFQDWTTAIGAVETLAGILHLIPDFDVEVKPFGIGTGIKWGGSFLGGATGAVARGLQIYATILNNASTNAGRKANFLRALQDRIFQANNSGHELKNIDNQIATQRLRVSTAEQEIVNQQTTLDQATQVEQFLRTKYTNQELYAWMESRTRSLYNSAYNLTYDLAKRAEKSFQFERPQMSTASYIETGYWSSARDGLLAGEALFLGLKKLEAAYQENLGHDFEVVKHISVRQWAPLALVEFRETGKFMLQLPEILFDMDCPGHYMRRIVSVSVSIPCIVGPYSSVNCTLRLQQHSMRVTPRSSSKNDYPQAADGSDDPRFQVLNVPISAVVLSSARDDIGRLDSPGDRYNPFEGAGCISTWSFELPTAIHNFDYSTITDVVMTIRYTSLDGGDKLKEVASGVVAEYIKAIRDASSADGEGLFTFFDLKAEFGSEWYRAGFGSTLNPVPQQVSMNLNNLSNRLPVYAASTPPNKILATSITILARGTSVNPADIQITQKPDRPGQDGQTASFKPGVDVGGLVACVSADSGLQLPMTSWILTVKQGSLNLSGMWMVVRYSLAS